jgi:dUTP pyrophosphatase
MKLIIKRIDRSLPLPAYQTKGSVAFDLYARIDISVKPFIPTIIPANLVIKVPKGYFLMICSRSSTPIRKNLIVSNGIGVIDQDYCGESDEIGIQVLNFSKNDVVVEKGERIGQAILVKIAIAEKFVEKKQMSSKSRGGWGSTSS